MAEATKEDAASPTGSTAADSMIRLLYLEIIRKDDCRQWKKDPQLCPQPQVSMNTIDDSTPEVIQERFDISHLSEHLTIWEKQLPKVQPFFSFSDVNAMTENSPKRTFQYEMDGLTWSCEYFVKTWVSKADNLMKILVIHLPNDGFSMSTNTPWTRLWERSRKRVRRTVATNIRALKTGSCLRKRFGTS